MKNPVIDLSDEDVEASEEAIEEVTETEAE